MSISKIHEDRAAVVPTVIILNEPGLTRLQQEPWMTAVFVSPDTGTMSTTLTMGFGVGMGRIELMISIVCDAGRLTVSWRVFAMRDGSNFRHHLTNPHSGISKTIKAAYDAVRRAADEIAATEIPDAATIMKLASIAITEEQAAVKSYIQSGRVPGPADRGVLQ